MCAVPSSNNLWSECQRLATEAAEFSLGLLWDRYTPTGKLIAGPTAVVKGPFTPQGSGSGSGGGGGGGESLQTVALLEERKGDNSVVVLVANTANVPMMFDLTLGGSQNYDDHAVRRHNIPPLQSHLSIYPSESSYLSHVI